MSTTRNAFKAPYLIYFPAAGSPDIGFITIAELKSALPFRVQRVFWTYDTPADVTRGRHGHRLTEQVLIALTGHITVDTETAHGHHAKFVLDNPSVGLYIPPSVWHTMRYSPDAVQLVLASTTYAESDYFREKADFEAFWRK
jgi:dTDP-4-dehydrorhamnose 3,5-epimerase-like enzyme